MNEALREHEVIILGACMNNRQEGYEALVDLYLSKYKFCEEYVEVVKYLIEYSQKALKGIQINPSDLIQKTGFTLEQYEFWQYEGKKDIDPSHKFLRDNKYLVDKTLILRKYMSKVDHGAITNDDFRAMEIELAAVSPLARFKTLADIDGEVGKDIQDIKENKKTIYQFGMPSLDKEFPLVPDEIFVIGGWSGSGKTNLACQLVMHFLKQGAKVVFISAENTEAELKIRLGAHLAKKPEANIYKMDSEDQKDILEAMITTTEKWGEQLTIASINNFEEALQFMKLRADVHGDEIFVLDYLQLFSSNVRSYQSDERARLDYFCEKLVEFKKVYRRPQFILSQVVEGASDTFKGSQSIRNMATIAGIIFRGKEIEKAYDSQRQKHKHFVRALIDIVKVRKGSPFKIYTHISWPDPMFHEVDAPSYTDTEELTKWKELIPKQKYR